MIIEGNKTNPCRRCGSSPNLATHLGRTDTNERVEYKDMKGFFSDSVHGAFQEINATAAGTRAQKAAYHAKIALAESEKIDDKQLFYAVEKLEKALGFEGQPRVVVEHEKHGRQHFHVVWSRIDHENMKAIDTPENYRKHEEVARELEKEFGLSKVKGAFRGRGDSELRPERNAPKWEYQQAERLEVTPPREMKAEVTALREGCQNGQEYGAALEKSGYILTKGDKSGFCVVDAAGGVHNLAKYSGMKAADLRAFMSDIDREKLPSVEQARECLSIGKTQAAECLLEKDFEKAAAEHSERHRKINPDIAFITDARAKAVDVAGLVDTLQKSGYVVLAVDDNDIKNMEKQRESGRFVPEFFSGDLAAMNAKGQLFRVTEDGRGANVPWVAAPIGAELNGKQKVSAEKSYNRWTEGREEKGKEVFSFDGYVAFVQEKYQKRHEHLDFEAFDKSGFSSVSEEKEIRRGLGRAMYEKEKAPQKSLADNLNEKESRGLARDYRAAVHNLKKTAREIEGISGEGLRVMDAGGKILGGLFKVATDIIDLFDPPKYQERTPKEIFASKEAERENIEFLKTERRSAAALDRMTEDVKAGRNIDHADIKDLSRDRLEELRAHGDEALNRMIEQREREQEQERCRRMER